MFIILVVVMLSQVYIYVKIHQIVRFKYVYFMDLNKAAKLCLKAFLKISF